MSSRYVLLLCFATALPAIAEDARPDSVRFGFQGHTHIGAWTEVELPAGSTATTLQADDAIGNRVSYPVAADGDALRSLVRLGVSSGTITADTGEAYPLTPADDREGGEPLIVHPASTSLWAVVRPKKPEDEADVLADAVFELQERPRSGVRVELIETEPGRFPTTAAALAELDYLLWNAPPPTQGEADALLRWVRDGGRLGISLDATAAWAGSPLIEPLPLRLTAQRFVTLDSLQRIAPNRPRINLPRGVNADALRIDLTGPGIRRGDGLLASVPLGFGSVCLLGVDLDFRPIATWDGLIDLHYTLANLRPASASESNRQLRTVTRSGITDLSTQLAAAVDDFGPTPYAAPVLSNWKVLGSIAIYAVLIGLVDYLLVHKLLRKPILTWITMPLMIAAALIYIGGETATSPAASGLTDHRAVRSRQLDLYDIDAATDADSATTRRLELAAVHVDDLGRYDISSQPWPEDGSLKAGWFVPLESNFGGLYHRGGLGLRSSNYAEADDYSGLRDYPIDRLGGMFLMSQGRAIDDSGELVTSKLKRVGRTFEGTLSHNLGGPIVDWFVAFDRSLVTSRDPQPIEPGQTFTIDRRTARTRGLRDRLTGLRGIQLKKENENFNKDTITTEKYDIVSSDLAAIVRTATFFEAAGGTEYTTITSHLPYDLDLSDTLPLGRAVLFGRLDVQPPSLLVGKSGRTDGETEPQPTAAPGQTPSDVFVRILLPIEPASDGESSGENDPS